MIVTLAVVFLACLGARRRGFSPEGMRTSRSRPRHREYSIDLPPLLGGHRLLTG